MTEVRKPCTELSPDLEPPAHALARVALVEELLEVGPQCRVMHVDVSPLDSPGQENTIDVQNILTDILV